MKLTAGTFILKIILISTVDTKIIVKNNNGEVKNDLNNSIDDNFDGVYTECFLRLSYTCVQRKTLMYLNQLNNLSEVSVIGDFVKFVKLNTSNILEEPIENATETAHFYHNSDELTRLIDNAVDNFFDSHVIKFEGLGKTVFIPNDGDEFVGRKKRKGGGGGGHDSGDGGKKKMMMMAMMCMKMKLMMMVPAMMGMMGMMSFKGMMFSMMSFMISKMMLLMKILEKKGGVGGAIGGGGDGGWAAGGAGGGAWMPAGGQDYAGGGGYDANGQWQGRSIPNEKTPEDVENKPVIYYVNPVVAYNQHDHLKLDTQQNKDINNGNITSGINETAKVGNGQRETRFHYANNNVYQTGNSKSRHKRSILDLLQTSYLYWMNKLFGVNNNRRTSNIPKYKIVNGIKYVFYPYRQQKIKMPKEMTLQNNKIKNVDEGFKPIITAEDFNKGEIMEGAIEGRMNKKKMNKIKDTVNDTIDDNPWE